MRYIINFLLLFVPISMYAQGVKRERDWKPSEIYFSADIVGLSKLVFSQGLQTEYQAKIDFDQFFLAVDLGYKNYSTSGSMFDYQSNGAFMRIGGQMNVIPYNAYRSNIFIGLSYGAARFSDELNYSQVGVNWDDSNFTMSNKLIKASWAEINTGMNVRIAGPIYMGYMIRLKLAKRLSGADASPPYDIPGFGRASVGSGIGFNYYITYRLGFRNKPIPVRPQKAKRLEKTGKGTGE